MIDKFFSIYHHFYLENKIENRVFDFDQNLDLLLDQSDLCITRAGASSLAEIAILNIPFIAIPLPSSKDNHQFENANFYQNFNKTHLSKIYEIDKNKIKKLKKKSRVKNT